MDWVHNKTEHAELDVLAYSTPLLLFRAPTGTELDVPSLLAGITTNADTSSVPGTLLHSLTRTPYEVSLLLSLDGLHGSTLEALITARANLLRIAHVRTGGAGEPALPAGYDVDGPWSLLRLRGPFEFSYLGVLSTFSAALARAGVSLFVISTWDTDYVLVKKLDEARKALEKDGWRVLDGE